MEQDNQIAEKVEESSNIDAISPIQEEQAGEIVPDAQAFIDDDNDIDDLCRLDGVSSDECKEKSPDSKEEELKEESVDEPEVADNLESPNDTEPEVADNLESPNDTEPEVADNLESPNDTEPKVAESFEPFIDAELEKAEISSDNALTAVESNVPGEKIETFEIIQTIEIIETTEPVETVKAVVVEDSHSEKTTKMPADAKNAEETETAETADAVSPSKTDNSEEAKREESSEKTAGTVPNRLFGRGFWRYLACDLFLVVLLFTFTFIFLQKWISMKEVIIQGSSQIQGSLESGEKTNIGNINVLVMGIDSVEGTHRSDTIFVLGVNPSKRRISMLSIPRDTRVIIDNKARKINEILPRYGEPTLRKMIEDLLKITISRKAEVGFESFISVIDALGGVDINIEKAMNYDDNWGNLHIHFKPGMNHLDGRQALNYVRFRKDAMADLGRIKRQQGFVKAVIKKLISPSGILKLPSIIEKAFQYIKTDFTLSEILTIVKGFDNFDVKIQTLSLPGEARYVDKISYFMPYLDKAVSIGNSFFSDLALFEIEKPYNSVKSINTKSKSNGKQKQ